MGDGRASEDRAANAARTGLSNREALVAVLVALSVGVFGSLALRAPARPEARADGATTERAVHWRVPVAFGTNLPALGDNILYVSEQVEATSGGSLRLEVFEPGELVPPFSITEAVRDAKVPAGYTWLGYDQGRLPWSSLFGAVPFGMEPWEYTAWWYHGGGRELAEELYSDFGIHVLLCGIIGPESAGWFREPIEDVEDLRGLKIRFAGLGGLVIQRLGASVTMLPGGEIFQALEKGAIDATEFSMPAIDQRLGFDRIVSFNYFPGWHQPFTAFHLTVNPKAWAELSPRQQAVLETTCTAGITRNLAHGEAIQGGALRVFRERGVHVSSLPDDVLHELARVSDEVLEEQAAINTDFHRVLESQRAFSADYQDWKRIGFLPRDFR
jgi:TRAP-type mannitol/chloroaromatic compound transport system substrate-binding protein